MGIYSEYLDQPLAGSVELLAAGRLNFAEFLRFAATGMFWSLPPTSTKKLI